MKPFLKRTSVETSQVFVQISIFIESKLNLKHLYYEVTELEVSQAKSWVIYFKLGSSIIQYVEFLSQIWAKIWAYLLNRSSLSFIIFDSIVHDHWVSESSLS